MASFVNINSRTLSTSTAKSESSQSRRSSLAKSATRLQSRLEALKPSRRSRSDTEQLTPGNEEAEIPRRPIAELFFSLPIELQQIIISFVDISTIFSLRATSRAFNSLIFRSAGYITRRYVVQEIPPSCRNLCREPPFNLEYLYHVHHALTIATNVAHLLADFVDSEILKDVGETLGDDERSRFVTLAVPPLLTLSHFYSTMRKWTLHFWPLNLNNRTSERDAVTSANLTFPITRSLASCDIQTNDELFYSREFLLNWDGPPPSPGYFRGIFNVGESMMRHCYDPNQLMDANDMETFIRSSLMRLLRRPTYLSFIERVPRASGRIGGQPAEHSVDSLLIFGGLDEARLVLSKKSYSQRVDEVIRWRKSLHQSECIRWIENWKYAIHGPFADGTGAEYLNAYPNHSQTLVPAHWRAVWHYSSIALLRSSAGRPVPQSTRNYVSELVGYDILRGTRWAL